MNSVVTWVRIGFGYFAVSNFDGFVLVLYPTRFLEGEDVANNFLFNADRWVHSIHCGVLLMKCTLIGCYRCLFMTE